MRLSFITFFACFFCSIVCVGQKDSISRKISLIFGVKASIVQCTEIFESGDYEGSPKLRVNGEGYASAGIASKRFRAILDFGYSKYQTIHVTKIQRSKYTYSYFYEFYSTKLNIEFLLGKNSQWIIALNAGTSSVFNFYKSYEKQPPLGDQKYEYEKPQRIFWGGISFGRSIKLTKHLNLDILVGNNLSTTIFPMSKNWYYYDRNTTGRNLLVKSLSIQLIYKI